MKPSFDISSRASASDRSAGGHDRVRGREVLGRQLLAVRAHRVRERREGGAQCRFVAGVDRARDLVVELVQLLLEPVVDPPLALAEHAHDHFVVASSSPAPGSSFAGVSSPVPSSAFILASSSSTCAPCEICASCRSMSSPDEV